MVYTSKTSFSNYLRNQMGNLSILNSFIFLHKSHNVYLKPEGEICNRLKAGAKVYLHQTKGNWTKISWRNGKKSGWVKIGS